MLNELERTAREENASSLGLWSSLNAVEFYAFCGYKEITEHVFEFDAGVEGTVVEMRTEL